MDYPSGPLPPSPPPRVPVMDEARLEALLRQTIAEQTADVATAPDALPRLNARLDATHAPKRWFGPLRLAGAVAVALILLALVTPVGRLAAANVTHDVRNAAQTVITTVKQVVSGTSDSGTPPPQGTLPAPNATDASASRAAATNGAGSPASGTVANPSSVTRTGTPSGAASQVVPVSPTPTPRATDQPTATGAAVGTATATAPPPGSAPLPGPRATNTPAPAAATTSPTSAAATAVTPATVATPGTDPTATLATTTPTPAIKGGETPVHEAVSPAPIPSPRTTAPIARSTETVTLPGLAPTGADAKGRNDQCAGQQDVATACPKETPPSHP